MHLKNSLDVLSNALRTCLKTTLLRIFNKLVLSVAKAVDALLNKILLVLKQSNCRLLIKMYATKSNIILIDALCCVVQAGGLLLVYKYIHSLKTKFN